MATITEAPQREERTFQIELNVDEIGTVRRALLQYHSQPAGPLFALVDDYLAANP